MIIRKPYAFLIKHFKLLHVILSALMITTVFQTVGIMKFFNDYITGITSLADPGTVSTIFFDSYLVATVIIIIIALIGFTLMKYKHKPSKLYFYITLTYINYFIFYMITYSVVKKLEITLIDVKELKLYNDLAFVFLIAQIMAIIFSIIRATGFNIKKFDFKNDLDKLEISEKDNEEVEISVDVDTGKIKRALKRSKRHLKYMYVENKMVIWILVISCIVFVSSYIVIDKYFVNNYSSIEKFKIEGYDFDILDSYITSRDYDNNEIYNKNKEVLIIRTRIKSSFNKKINVGNFYLKIGENHYHHKQKYNSNISDLGERYNDQRITTEYQTYLLVFEIPKAKDNQKKILYYNAYDNETAIEVKPRKLDLDNKEEKEASLNQTINFQNSVLKNSTLIISDYELNDNFIINYKVKIAGEIFEYKEYIKSMGLSKYKTTVLKLTGEFKLDPILGNGSVNNLSDLLNYYGKINYIKDNQQKELNMKLNVMESKYKKDSDYYIEIPSEVSNSEKIDIILDVRDKKYIYHLK